MQKLLDLRTQTAHPDLKCSADTSTSGWPPKGLDSYQIAPTTALMSTKNIGPYIPIIDQQKTGYPMRYWTPRLANPTTTRDEMKKPMTQETKACRVKPTAMRDAAAFHPDVPKAVEPPIQGQVVLCPAPLLWWVSSRAYVDYSLCVYLITSCSPLLMILSESMKASLDRNRVIILVVEGRRISKFCFLDATVNKLSRIVVAHINACSDYSVATCLVLRRWCSHDRLSSIA